VPGYCCTSAHILVTWCLIKHRRQIYVLWDPVYCNLSVRSQFCSIQQPLRWLPGKNIRCWHCTVSLESIGVVGGWWDRSYLKLQELVKMHWTVGWSQQSVDQNIFILAADCKLYYREVCIQICALVIFWPGYERRVSCHTAKLEPNWRVSIDQVSSLWTAPWTHGRFIWAHHMTGCKKYLQSFDDTWQRPCFCQAFFTDYVWVPYVKLSCLSLSIGA
jgi:hypothetical protein